MPAGGPVPKVAEAQIAERGQKIGQDRKEKNKRESQWVQAYHRHHVTEPQCIEHCVIPLFFVKQKTMTGFVGSCVE